ncbi:hypothetical protein OFC24_30020, partial [Escherichia coli]|nr:hypothetical protein [Escherichia coli]
QQTISSLINAVNSFEENSHNINPSDCRNNALKFSAERFREEFNFYVTTKWLDFNTSKSIEY